MPNLSNSEFRIRCGHPSGTGRNPHCRKPAVGAVEVEFINGRSGKARWSKPIPACVEHLNSGKWYRQTKPVEVWHDTDGYGSWLEIQWQETRKWLRVRRIPLGEYQKWINNNWRGRRLSAVTIDAKGKRNAATA